MSDRILGVIGLCLAIFFAWAASIIQESFLTDAVGPKMFPYIIAAVAALASVYFILRPDADPEWPGLGRLAEIGAAAVVLCLYAIALPELGFLIATAFAATYLAWRLGSRPLEAVLTGLGTSVGIYVIFRLVLGLSLARGPFGF